MIYTVRLFVNGGDWLRSLPAERRAEIRESPGAFCRIASTRLRCSFARCNSYRVLRSASNPSLMLGALRRVTFLDSGGVQFHLESSSICVE